MLFAGGMAEASTEDLFAHETRQNPGPLQMRKKPPAVLFQHGNRADFLREQRAKKTTPGREEILSAGKNRTARREHGVQKRVTSTEVFGDILCPSMCYNSLKYNGGRRM